jgi:hypothetical protein
MQGCAQPGPAAFSEAKIHRTGERADEQSLQHKYRRPQDPPNRRFAVITFEAWLALLNNLVSCFTGSGEQAVLLEKDYQCCTDNKRPTTLIRQPRRVTRDKEFRCRRTRSRLDVAARAGPKALIFATERAKHIGRYSRGTQCGQCDDC